MLPRLQVAIPLREAEVDKVYVAGLGLQQYRAAGARSATYTDIVRLDVSMDEAPRVKMFDYMEHLISDHEHSLQAELAPAHVEQVF